MSLSDEYEVVAAGCLVHDMTRDNESRTKSCLTDENLPQTGPQNRVETHCGFVQDNQVRRTEEGDSQAYSP